MKDKIKSLVKKIKNVDVPGLIEGATNKITGDMEDIATERADICSKCDLIQDEPIKEMAIKDSAIKSISGKICGECFCALPYKVRQNNTSCPLNKW